MALAASAEMTLCERAGSRGEVHAHMADEHPEAVRTWSEPESGRMRYLIACPRCGAEHEARVKPRSHDPSFLAGFAREIRLVAFDMLLCHLEAEHEQACAPEPSNLPRSKLPAASAGGGRGRPGAEGVPLPPGMAEPELPGWMQAVEAIKVRQVKRSGSDT
jgi:hypothetical protein